MSDRFAPFACLLFLLPRTRRAPSKIAALVRSASGDVVEARDSAAATVALAGRAPDVLLFPSSGCVAAIDEYLRAIRNVEPRPLVAAMGELSSRAAKERGFPPDLVPREPGIAQFVECVAVHVAQRSPL